MRVCLYTHPRVQVKMPNHTGCLPMGIKLALSCTIHNVFTGTSFDFIRGTRFHTCFIPFKTKYWRGINFADWWFLNKNTNPPIIFLHRYTYACVWYSPIFNPPKRVLHYFAKYYSRQYFVLYGIMHECDAFYIRIYVTICSQLYRYVHLFLPPTIWQWRLVQTYECLCVCT